MSGNPLPEDQLVDLFDRLRKLAIGENPLRDSTVTMPQLALLHWVEEHPGCGIRGTAQGLNLTAPTISVGVRRLERAGLLERQPHPQDGRAIRLFLSEEGRVLCQQALALRRNKMQSLLGGLTPTEGETLVVLLERAVSAAEKVESKRRSRSHQNRTGESR